MTTRWLYANSTRSSHAVERVSVGGKVSTVALCGRNPEWGDWQISFNQKKPLCKQCAATMKIHEQLLQRRYRTLMPLVSHKDDDPWSLPRGAVSVGVTYANHRFYVHFLTMGRVVLPMRKIDGQAEWFECIFDPTQPQDKPLEELPLFAVAP